MVPVVGRSSWGALPPNRDPGYMEKCDNGVLHHTVGLHPLTINDAYAEMRRLQAEALAKTEPDGTKTYSDIPYNLVCGPGVVFVGRGPNANDGATDDDISTDTVSVAVMGDYTKVRIDPEYQASIDTAVELCRLVWGWIEFVPHFHYYNTQCPATLVDLLPAINTKDDDMTEQEFFDHPLTLSDGEPPTPFPTTVEGWFVYVHRELQIIRQKLESKD